MLLIYCVYAYLYVQSTGTAKSKTNLNVSVWTPVEWMSVQKKSFKEKSWI